MRIRIAAFLPAALLVLALAAGCHSRHVESTVENRTGEPVQLLEVDYPNASFGKNSLDAGADFRYRFQISGSGKIKVGYTSAAGRQIAIDGPELAEGQEGRLEIVLLPGGKADFHAELSAPR